MLDTLEVAKVIIFLVLFVVALSIFFYRLYKSYRVLQLGKGSASRFDRIHMRIWSVIVYVFGQIRLVTRRVGFLHFFIFWGFVILLPSILQAIGEGLFPGFVLPFFAEFGPFILLQEIFAVLVLVAIIISLYNRLILKPERYHGSNAQGAVMILAFIFLIMTSLLATYGITGLLGNDNLTDWRLISTLLVAPLSGLPTDTLNVLLEISWWIHIGSVLLLLTYLPEGKHFHIITVIPNVFFRNLSSKGKMTPLPADSEDSDSIGISSVENFSWKRILDLFSCTECGRCQDVCPAYATNGVLSPKLVIINARHHLEDKAQVLLSKSAKGNEVLDKKLVGDVITTDELWDCTTCFACSQECPLFIEHVDMIIEMRRSLAYEGMMGDKIQEVLENYSRYGNSFGETELNRTTWISELDFKVKDVRNEYAEYLWFVGDYASYNEEVRKLTVLTAQILNHLGIDFGILYEDERNAGNDVRRIGEEGLFEELVEQNMDVLKEAKFSKIITTDPHTFNTLKNEYPDYGLEQPVYHFVEVVDKVMQEHGIVITNPLNYTVTYQDPCYLGRYNDVYEAPRKILQATGVTLLEMPRNKKKAFCCGAGGGMLWKEDVKVKERPAENRIREALSLGNIDFFTISCPKDLVMFSDAIKTTENEDKIQVKDIIELLAESLGLIKKEIVVNA